MDARHRLHVDRGQPLQAGRPPTSRAPSGSPARPGHPKDGRVRVSRETSGRKGNVVTLVTGLPLTLEKLEVLGRELKLRCGTGGSVKGGVIELQGDHREAVLADLLARGYPAKAAGG
jgi:translation initiation factor 1